MVVNLTRPAATAVAAAPSTGRSTAKLVALGGLLGLAWAAGLRGMMSALAGDISQVSWAGTFIGVLAAGTAAGGLLGWAEAIRRSGGRPGWRWLAVSPLVLIVGFFTNPDPVTLLVTKGVGAAGLVIPFVGMAGGYALSNRGPGWARLLSGLLPAAFLVSYPLQAQFFGPALALTTPRGAWVAVYFVTFLVLFMLACSIPHRPVVPPAGDRVTPGPRRRYRAPA